MTRADLSSRRVAATAPANAHSPTRRRWQETLVAAELALAVALLAGAELLLTSYYRLSAVDLYVVNLGYFDALAMRPLIAFEMSLETGAITAEGPHPDRRVPRPMLPPRGSRELVGTPSIAETRPW